MSAPPTIAPAPDAPTMGPEKPARRSLFSGRALSHGERVFVGIVVGIVGAWLAGLSAHGSGKAAKDFTYPWRAARALLAGQNPYDVIVPAGAYPFESHLPYPLPAALVGLPFAWLTPWVAAAAFFGLGCALLAYAVTRDGLWRLWMFLSVSFVLAFSLAQWSPLLMAGALLPWLGWVLVCKPTLGAALFAYRPSKPAVIGGALLLLVSFVLVPTWLGDWLRATRTLPIHQPPVLHAWGWIPLLALLRWRTPEARLVAVMALVPQNLYFYDQLLLWLVPWNALTTLALTASSWLGWLLAARACESNFCGAEAEPWVIALVYVPATVLALLRPGVKAAEPRPAGEATEAGTEASGAD